jgi:hypothetical protein
MVVVVSFLTAVVLLWPALSITVVVVFPAVVVLVCDIGTNQSTKALVTAATPRMRAATRQPFTLRAHFVTLRAHFAFTGAAPAGG